VEKSAGRWRRRAAGQSRLIVVCDAAKVRAMAVNASSASRRAIASSC
jgi:hypothetical protein